LLLAGVGIAGLVAEYPEPHNRGQPTITPRHNAPESKFAVRHTPNQNNKKGEQERSWVEGLFAKLSDTLPFIFNGLLVLFTGLLYRATSGLFKETAELRRIANDQRADLSRSITAAEKSADAAKRSANAVTAQMRAYVSAIAAKIHDFDEDGKSSVHLRIGKTGQTTAFAVTSNHGVTIREATATRFKGELWSGERENSQE
jgi:hypothetical protein